MRRNFEKIRAWQEANELALAVYQATKSFPKSEIWALTSQLRRAAISVPANIVEGSSRKNRKEYLQFLYIALSSLNELSYYLTFSKEIGYLQEEEFGSLQALFEKAIGTLHGLICYIEKS